MKFVISSLVDTIDILKRERRLLFLYLFFGLLPVLSASIYSPFVLKVILLSVSLGWFVTRFSFLDEALHKKKLSIDKIFSRLLNSLIKVIPILMAMLVITLIPIAILLLWYGRWFAQSYLNNGLGLTSQQVFVQLVNALGDNTLWNEFFGQNFLMKIIHQVYLTFILVGILVAKLTAIFIAVQEFKGFDSVVKSFSYLSSHIALLFSFIIFHIIGNIFFRFILVIFNASLGNYVPQLYPVIYVLLSSIIWLFLDVYVLAYFNKTINTTSLKNTVMKWFRKKS